MERLLAQWLFEREREADYLFWGARSQRFRVGYSVWMRVCVLYFGVLKDLVGHGRSEMDLAEGASVAELLEAHRGLAKGRVYEIRLSGVTTVDGEPVLHPDAYYTLNELVK